MNSEAQLKQHEAGSKHKAQVAASMLKMVGVAAPVGNVTCDRCFFVVALLSHRCNTIVHRRIDARVYSHYWDKNIAWACIRIFTNSSCVKKME